MTDTRSMNFVDAQLELIAVARNAHARGWVPATSGNFSARLGDGGIAITVSGRDKGRLSAIDIMRMSAEGTPEGQMKPSAEALLHLQLYRRDGEINAVLHTHSVNATIASQADSSGLRFHDLEILKAFSGIETHATSISIPIFKNSQDIKTLAEDVEHHMAAEGQGIGYLIAGHGLYTWGADLAECMRHLEALEFLFDYDRLKHSGAAANE